MASDPFILGFDTSAAHCAAALLSGDKIVAARHEQMRKGQAERLMPMLEEVLAEAGRGWHDLDAIGVGVGPGNFTGIRIAVSAARGLSLALEIPAVGVPITECLALDVPRPVLTTLDARRDQVYVQRFDGDGPGPIHMDTVNELSEPTNGLICVGHRAEEIAARLDASHQPAAFAPAEAVARLAAQRYPGTTKRPAPLYIRPADAKPPSDPPPVILT